jgi:RNA ligase
MLHYPKIPGSRNAPDGRCIAFEKYDGTNLHWEWEREFGWHSFGPRRDAFNLTEAGIELFGKTHAHLRQSVEVLRATLAREIETVFREHSNYRDFQSFKVFTEFFGPNSFAGLHKEEDPKELRLFDVWAEPFGMIGPKQLVADFGHLPIARVVYEGKLTGKFMEDVRLGKYGVNEGVVCKGGAGGADVWMVKIKTYAYKERLKQAFADRWEEFWE